MFRHATTKQVENSLTVVLIEGKEGSGRTTVVTWLKNQAAESNIPTACVRLNKKDTSVEYGLFKKLFVQLMPKDLFLNNNVQRGHIQELLRLTYPNADRSFGLSALLVLGVTCFTDDGAAIRFNPLPETFSRKRFVWTSDHHVRKTSILLQVSMRRIFAHLLRVRSTLVIIEALELADKASLALLALLGSDFCPSAFVCTALSASTNVNVNNLRQSNGSICSNITQDKDFIHAGPTVWAKEYRDQVLRLRNTSLISLENYTPDEINKLLCLSLGVKFVPPEVSQLVLDFSGGSYFWVREILHFIQEHGQETFMDALGEAAVPVSAEGEDNHFSRLLRIKAPSTNAHGFLSRTGSKVFIQHDIESAQNPGNLQPPLRRSSSMGHLLTAVHEHKVVSPKHKQLDHLLLIRFGKLLPSLVLRSLPMPCTICSHRTCKNN